MNFVEYSYKRIFGTNYTTALDKVKVELFALFDVYMSNNACSSSSVPSLNTDLTVDLYQADESTDDFLSVR